MTTFDDYEVLSILGTNLNSTCYKVRHKTSNHLYVWKAVNYEQCNLSEAEVVKRINNRKNTAQNILLPIHDYIRHEETSTIYLITEYCKHGSLLDLTRRCKKNGEYLHEDFVWNVLYKLSCFCKVNKLTEGFNPHEVFVDAKHELKMFNFNLSSEQSCKQTSLRKVVRQLVYISGDKFPDYYSNELRNLVEFMLEPPEGVKPTIDAILCHPTALTRINLQIDSIFVKLTESPSTHEQDNPVNIEAQLENLRNREANVKKQEEKLRQQMLELDKREKKVILSERNVKEKMMKAELYLKRARDARSSVITGSSGNTNVPARTKKELIDSIDVSYSPDCGDSSILPRTSCKLNIRELPKPPKFTRTLSERRVRFKHHSPLKEINNFKKETLKMQQELKKMDGGHSDSDKTSETNSDKVTMEKKPTRKLLLGSMFSKKPSGKKLGSVGSSTDSYSAHTYEDIDKCEDLEDCKPINWTRESKRHAFDLLRIMNGEENVNGVKHTFL